MKDKQENKLSSTTATKTVLDNNNSIWSGNPLFVTIKAALDAKIAEWLAARQLQQNIITGIAVDKGVLRALMVGKTIFVASRVAIFAEDTSNNELFNEVNFTQTDFDLARDEMVAGICRNVHDKANAHIAALAAYGVTALILTDLDSAIGIYEAKAPQPRAAQSARKAVTSQIVVIIKDTDKILKNRLDKLMLDYKTPEPVFYNAYKNARIIIDLGATHSKLNMFIKDSGAQPVAGATATLLQGEVVKYIKISGPDGKLAFTQVAPGTYDLKVEKPNFITKTETGIVFTAGKKVSRTVTLQAAGADVVLVGDVPTGVGVHNIQIGTINPGPASMVSITVTGEGLDLYASPSPNALPAGPTYHVPVGTVTLTLEEFAALVGFSETNTKLNVMNNGAAPGHYTITFSGLLP